MLVIPYTQVSDHLAAAGAEAVLQEKEALDAALQVRLRRVWYGVAELVSLALFDVICGDFKSCTFLGMILPRVVISLFQRLRVLSLASAAGAFGQTELILVWGSARLQVNYTPGVGIRDTAEDVCDVMAADDDEACVASLKEQILQQELHYFNLRDGKNLTWQQRPLRFLSDEAAVEYTQGVAEVLDVYRDDSQTQYYRPYDAASINVLINRAGNLLPGTNYRDVDALIYKALAKGELNCLKGAQVAVIGSVMPW